ncbi:ATP-binding protein [Paenibacillus terrigena]|uniref:sensor histidine kinase n=1 Tax=Paenibacillus terrigena TaxID=369333 RepID=UPI0028D61BC8|nr:ATP-binding protein [Paenibacillus terrigena]
MRGIELDNVSTFPLDGKWQFYPDSLLSHQDIQMTERQPRSIQVPGDWSHTLTGGSDSSYGYGTYRLRILINPQKQPIAIWMKGIQASSAIEINGLATGGIGDVASHASEYRPPLTIQLLVENAVRHGLLSRQQGGMVHFRIAKQDGYIRIDVIDDGKGMAQDKVALLLNQPSKSKGGIGLYNTNRRFTRLYGQGLSIHSKPHEGTTVSFVIPNNHQQPELHEPNDVDPQLATDLNNMRQRG